MAAGWTTAIGVSMIVWAGAFYGACVNSSSSEPPAFDAGSDGTLPNPNNPGWDASDAPSVVDASDASVVDASDASVIDASDATVLDAGDASAQPIVLSGTNSGTCMIRGDGRMKCWGFNLSGQLGLGDTMERGADAGQMGANLPFVDLAGTAVAVAGGGYQHCAILTGGQVKCWGQNAMGTLGYGDLVDRGGDAGQLGTNLPYVDLGTGRTAVAIVEGMSFACALLDDATVKCWGNNETGQLGLGDKNNRGDNPGEMGDALPAVNLGSGRTVKQLAAGGNTACAILDNGQLKCWGGNGWCELGLDTLNDVGTAPGQMGDALPAVDLGTGRTAKLVAAGFAHACAVLDNDELKCWGNNNYGQLGQGDATMRGCGTLADGGPGKTVGDALPPVSLGTGRTPKALGLGWSSTCVLLDDHSIKCWGSGADGNLGVGDQVSRGASPSDMGDNLPAAKLGTGRSALVMTSGDYHVCAILDNGGVKCWGRNSNGQLGLGDPYARGTSPGLIGDNLPYVDLGP